MASDTNNVAEENFNKFRESMYQYLNEPIKDFVAIKPQLLDIFKTHRPVRNVDYQYGLSKSLKGKSQLIIHEFNQNRSAVKEYFKAGNQVWHCCECTRTGASKNDDGIADLLVVHGIVFVKLEHDCKPRELSFIQKVQKLYKEKKVDEADALQKEVLGSEDLNVPVKQKSGAAKRGTKTSPESTNEVDAEIASIVNSARQKYNDNQDKGSLHFIDMQKKLSPEEAYAKIIENLEEYTNESKEVVMANKSKILSSLKTHHYPIKLCNYVFDLSQNLQKDHCLIAFEWGDRKRVRYYSKKKTRPNLWACRECFRLQEGQKMVSFPDLHMINGIAFVPSNHVCLPRDYELVMQYQRYLEDGDMTKARRMAQIVDFTYGVYSLKNVINAIDTKSTSLKLVDVNESSSKALTNSKRKKSSDCIDEKSPLYKKSRLSKSTLDNTVIDENDLGLYNEKIPVCNKSKPNDNQKNVIEKVDYLIRSEPTTSDVSNSIYHFEKLSTLKLQEICDKLDIRYCNKAAKLWDKIMFDQIDIASSTPKETHYFETDNVYQILSIIFTGKSKQHEQIKTTIIDAFRDKMVSSGDISTKKFNKKYLDTVTDEHFDFIAKHLSSRILIFDDDNGIKKYGKWKSNTSIRLTLVVALKDRYYSIVLKL